MYNQARSARESLRYLIIWHLCLDVAGLDVGVQASGFRRRGSGVGAAILGPAVSTAEIETLHPKFGQLVVEWDF